MKLIDFKKITLLILLLVSLCAGAQQATPQQPQDRNVEQGVQLQQFTYQQRFAPQSDKTFIRDPFVWAYTNEFAEKFHMPKEWVDTEIKGFQAVAWRMSTIDQELCGLMGNPKKCAPVLTCQMDLYFDHSTPLPWGKTDPVRDYFLHGLSSMDFIPPLPTGSSRARYRATAGQRVPFLNGALRYLNNSGWAVGPVMGYFDREFELGITIIGFTRACPGLSGRGGESAATFDIFSNDEQERSRGVSPTAAVTVVFSGPYMKKINDIYHATKALSREFSQSIYQEAISGGRFPPLIDNSKKP